MKYQLNDIFYSLQGEGLYSGTPAIFVRLSGCNQACLFCDTDHSLSFILTEDDISNKCQNLNTDCRIIVLTGGEPTIQNLLPLVEELQNNNYTVHLETNGTLQWPSDIDFVTLSPKTITVPSYRYKIASQLKILFRSDDTTLIDFYREKHSLIYIQPIDGLHREKNTKAAIEYCLKHPEIRLSLQTHKLIGVK